MNSLTHYLENISDDLNPAVRNFRYPKDVLAQLIYTSKFISDIFMLHATNSLIHYLENISDDFNSAVRNFRRPKYAQYSKTSVAPKPLVFFMERILLEILLKSTVNCIFHRTPQVLFLYNINSRFADVYLLHLCFSKNCFKCDKIYPKTKRLIFCDKCRSFNFAFII